MFGFGKRAKLKKIGDELKGASLQEVVERFADDQFLQPPAIKFDRDVARLFSDNITKEDLQNPEILPEKLHRITSEHCLEEGSHYIWLAQTTFDALRSYALLDLAAAAKLLESKDAAVRYLFETWLRPHPAYNVIPILFPPKAGGRTEDFSIDRDVRYLMIDGLFARLRSVDAFENIINEFAIEHPYFRNYPL